MKVSNLTNLSIEGIVEKSTTDLIPVGMNVNVPKTYFYVKNESNATSLSQLEVVVVGVDFLSIPSMVSIPQFKNREDYKPYIADGIEFYIEVISGYEVLLTNTNNPSMVQTAEILAEDYAFFKKGCKLKQVIRLKPKEYSI